MDDPYSHRITKGNEKAISRESSEGAIDAINIDDEARDEVELEWEDYNAVEFGPDIVPGSSGSGNADPLIASASSHSSTDTSLLVT